MKRFAAIGVLLALPILLFSHRVLVEAPADHGFESFDATEYFHPTAVYLHESLGEGRLPLWNPYQLAGQPFLALHVPAVLYPPNLVVHALLGPALALAVLAVLHLSIAGAFAWLFATRLGLGSAASLAAGAGYMLCGSLIFGLYNPAYVATMAWLPAILWSVHGLCSDPHSRWTLALGSALALAFLAGHTQGLVYELHIALPYGLFALGVVARRGQRLRALLLAGAAGLLAAGLVAPQALPTLELQHQAVRSLEGISFRDATLHSYAPERVLQGLLGLPAPEPSHPLGPLGWSAAWPFLGLPLFLCGLLPGRHRAHWIFFAASALAVGLFVLGKNTPAYSLYYGLPFGDLFRAPGRHTFVYSFCIAIGVAIGIDAIRDRLQGFRLRGGVAIPGLLAAIVTISLYLRSDLVSTHPLLEGEDAGPPAELVEQLRSDAGYGRVLLGSATESGAPSYTKWGMVDRFFAVPDYEPAIPDAYRRYFDQPGSTPWHGRLGLRNQGPRLAELMPQLDLMGVRFYAASNRSEARELARATGVRGHRVGGGTVFERRSAVPRVYVVHRVIEEADSERAMDRIRSRDFAPRREAVVDPGEARLPPVLRGPALPAAPGEGDSVSIESYAPEEVELRAECSRACLVVLTDLFYPGWRAYVDEQEQQVFRVNTLYRGVALAPGSHRVVYRFEPTSLRVGGAIATGTGLVVAAMIAVAFSRRARASSSSTTLLDDENEN